MAYMTPCDNPRCPECGRTSPRLGLIFQYIDKKHKINLKIKVTSPLTLTVSEATKDVLELLFLDDVSPNDVRLAGFGYQGARYCLERNEVHRTLNDLGLKDGYTLYFEPLPNAPSPKLCYLTIVGPDEVIKIDYAWYRAITTVEMLLQHVMKTFSLESIRRERIHLVTIMQEFDLFSGLDKRLSEMDVHSGMSVYVKIIPPLTSKDVVNKTDVRVRCIFGADKLMLEVSSTDTIEKLIERIEENVPSHHINDLKVFDALNTELHLGDHTRTLESFGIKQGQEIVAKFRQIIRHTASATASHRSSTPSSQSLSPGKKHGKVKVICQFPSKDLETLSMSVTDTVADLIAKIEHLCLNPRLIISEMRSDSTTINPKESDRCFADIGIKPDAVIYVTITEKSPTYASIVSKRTSSSSPKPQRNSRDSHNKIRKPTGLDNLGNSCYLNSALQCLAHVPPLTKFFLQGIDHAHMNDGEHTDDEWNPYDQVGDITGAYAELLWNLWRCEDQCNSFKPNRIKDKIGEKDSRFATNDQQDAQEFMSFFLDTMHKELKAKNKDDRNTIIKQFFFGKITSTIMCTACNHEEPTVHPISFLSIPLNHQERTFWINFIGKEGKDRLISVDVPIRGCVGHVVQKVAYYHKTPTLFYYITAMLHDGEVDFKTPLSEISTDEMVFLEQEERTDNILPEVLEISPEKSTLVKCLEQFFAREQLENERTCERNTCRKKAIAIKQLKLSSLPSVLIIQFKRFSHENGLHQKVQTFVDYPLTGLDLSTCLPYLQDKAVYDLIAVSNHLGSVFGGHYTAYARRTVAGKIKWYEFDDSLVKTVSHAYYEEDIVSKDAYLLFYIKRELLDEPIQITAL